MSSPLDRIEDEYQRIIRISSSSSVRADAMDVLALVAVARAAERAVEHDPDETEGREHLHALREALAALNKDTA